MVDDLLLATQIEGLPREESDGLYDRYLLGHEQLTIHLDRVAAGGVVLPAGVPGKGRVVSQLSAFWLDRTRNIVPNDFLLDDVDPMRRRLAALGATGDIRPYSGRVQLGNRTRPLPVVCDMIGVLGGVEWEEYQATGAVAGRPLPPGLAEGEPLPEVIYVPRSGSDGSTIDPHALTHALEPGHVRQIEQYSRELYRHAASLARQVAGLALVRARFEYGLLDGTVILVGSPLVPDTASFCEIDPDARGATGADVARSPLEEHLRRIHWQGGAHLPDLPAEVVLQTASGYRSLFERLTGEELA
jgi:phosphoribosylaminoimidazole-succinocarboxamide synthase